MINLIKRGKAIAGSRLALADRLGIVPATIIGWEKGSDPMSEHRRKLEEFVASADRNYMPLLQVQESAENEIFISGQVAAGKVSFAGEDQYFKTLQSLWGKSRYWPITTGDVIYLEIVGESMAPEYLPGEIIACRAPQIRAQDIPSGTPCIFQESDEDNFTFKIMRHGQSNEVIGQPLNPEFQFVIFSRELVQVPLIVLGKVQLAKSSMLQPSFLPRRKRERGV